MAMIGGALACCLRLLAAALFGWLALSPPVAAREPSELPILRIETGMHTTIIRRLVADRERNRLLTASDDKTIRVWQMPQARLLSIIRPPIDAGHEGRIFGLAVSPDGKTVAAAGWTGWDWDGKASIYLFETLSGKLLKRFGGFPNAVSGLIWHPDGQHLIVGLQGNAGLRVVRASDGSPVAEDPQYKDKIMDLDLAPNGRLAVVALDGMLRIYDPAFRLIGRKTVPGGKHPSAVRFSPDSNLIAVSVVDQPAITLFDARNLNLADQQPATKDLRNLAGFTSLAWSSDGERLYAGGDYRGDGQNPLYLWPSRGTGQRQEIPLARARINELQQLPGNLIAYATEDPGLGQIGPDQRIHGFRGPDVLDFSRSQGRIELSDDGSVVRYPVANGRQHTFSIFGPGDQALDKPQPLPLRKPRLSSPQIQLAEWQNSYKTTINGKPPALDDYEMVRSYALSADGRSVLLGTEWGLRRYDASARLLWQVPLPAVAWSVSASENAKFALAALSDGTLRWFDMAQGREVLAYFPHANGKDWIAWTPEGYYQSSVYGDNFVGWHLNRGKDKAADFFRAVQFERLLYRPDVVTSTFNAISPNKNFRLTAPPANTDFRIAQLREFTPARVGLHLERLQTTDDKARASLRLEVEKGGLPMNDYTVFVNGIPVTPYRDRQLSGKEQAGFVRQLDLDLYGDDNFIRVETGHGNALGLAEVWVGLPRTIPPPRRAGNLYLLSVGVNTFTGLPESMHLEFAAQDASAISQALTERARPLFKQVHVQLLNDFSGEKPERAAIVKALDFVGQAGPNDTILIFLASHGVSDPAGNYFFVPRDSLASELKQLGKAEPPKSLIGWQVFFDALRNASGKRILVVDTCHSQAIEGRFESHSLLKRSAASLFPILVSARSDEEAQEYQPAKQGLFTYSLLQSLNPTADANRDGALSLEELFDSAQKLVEKLHDRNTGSQTPQFLAPAGLGTRPVVLFTDR